MITNDVKVVPKLPIFLDYQATTKPDERVLDAMQPYWHEFSNSHSMAHAYGWKAEAAISIAREKVASVIGALPDEIIFTSGATESNNLALKGLAEFYSGDISSKKKHIITSKIEHKSVIDVCKHLATSRGFEVTFLNVNSDGFVNPDELKSLIRNDTLFVSVMAVNNEIGTVQPIAEIGSICKEKGVFFHTDAAQAYSKIKLDVVKDGIDLLSLSGHKIYGPMGIGALYVRKSSPRVRLSPLFHGGAQERNIRSGTVPTPLVVGLGEAASIAAREMDNENAKLLYLKNKLYNGIKEGFSHAVLNGSLENSIPGNLNLSFPYIEGESVIMALRDLAISSGSACTSSFLESSHVIKALNKAGHLDHSSIRFGIGRYTTEDEIDYIINLVPKKLQRLMDMSPLWDMAQDGIDLESVKWHE